MNVRLDRMLAEAHRTLLFVAFDPVPEPMCFFSRDVLAHPIRKIQDTHRVIVVVHQRMTKLIGVSERI